jgi:hypothetical protein
MPGDAGIRRESFFTRVSDQGAGAGVGKYIGKVKARLCARPSNNVTMTSTLRASDFFSLPELIRAAARHSMAWAAAMSVIGAGVWLFASIAGRDTDKAVALTLVLPFFLVALIGCTRTWMSRRELLAPVRSRVGIAHLGFAAAWAVLFVGASTLAEILVRHFGLSTSPSRSVGDYLFNWLGLSLMCVVLAAVPVGRRT